MVIGTRLGDHSRQVVAQRAVDGAAGDGTARGRGQPEGDDLDGTAQVPGRGQTQASLEAGEGDRAVGGENRTIDGAVIDAGSAGQVNGDDAQRTPPRRSGGNERGYEGDGVGPQRPGGPDTGESVKDEPATGEEGLDGGHGLSAVPVLCAVAAVAGAVDGDPVAAGLFQGDGVRMLRGEYGSDRAAAV